MARCGRAPGLEKFAAYAFVVDMSGPLNTPDRNTVPESTMVPITPG